MGRYSTRCAAAAAGVPGVVSSVGFTSICLILNVLISGVLSREFLYYRDVRCIKGDEEKIFLYQMHVN